MFRSYKEATDWLFTQIPVFHRHGESAYKPGLERTLALAGMFGNPHKGLVTIHVGGTNGKGSVASTLASILQATGLRTGLFTSPHLVDFRERIRVNGEMIDKRRVSGFINRFLKANMELEKRIEPSFFELTTVMALDYFRQSNVDIAVIEVGLGGRLDSTNIISPILSVITNISLDHTSLLGNTLTKIAAEKAGIIKEDTPVVIGETHSETHDLFLARAMAKGCRIRFADSEELISKWHEEADGTNSYILADGMKITSPLSGECQARNMATILTAIDELRRAGIAISDEAVAKGVSDVCTATGLDGRWTVSKTRKGRRIIYDTGHNPGGWEYTSARLSRIPSPLTLVIGFVNDKDVDTILDLIAKAELKHARYIFTAPDVERALPAEELRSKALAHGLEGEAETDLKEALKKAFAKTDGFDEDSVVFVGGSNYLVARLLENRIIERQ